MKRTLQDLERTYSEIQDLYSGELLEVLKYVLNAEINRRKHSGRKPTSKFTRKEQVRQATARYRAKLKASKT